MLVNLPAALTIGTAFMQREREGDPGNEKEKRENHIIKMKTVPFNMLSLNIQPLDECGMIILCQGMDDKFTTHDPEHIESPERVERSQAVSCFCFHVLFVLGRSFEFTGENE